MAQKYPAKVIRPVFKNALKRERLFNLLDDPDKQLIWISGPAGYGKTTLISDYIGHKKIPCLWYQIDSRDKDPATFYYYLGLSHRASNPQEQIPFLSYTPEFASDPDKFSLNFFEKLFKKLEAPHFIVFDNLIHRPENYFINALISAMSKIPPGMHIAVASRTEPPPGLSIINVRNQMMSIGVKDLSFNLDEFRQAAALYGAANASENTIKIMHNRTEGWVAGLVLMAESYKRLDLDPGIEAGSTRQEIYDFFAGEIGKNIGKKMRQFLMKTAFLPEVTVQTARDLTDYNRADEVLDYLVSHNIFTTRRDMDPDIYQYHSLFREYLQKSAAMNLTAEQVTDTKCRAARVLKESGQFEQAAFLFIEAGAWEELSSLILAYAPEIVQNGRHKLLEEWLSSIPGELSAHDQRLLFWKGICRLPFSPESSQPYFMNSTKLAIKAGDAETSYRSWSVAVESVVYAHSDLSRLDELIELFEEIREAFPQYPSVEIEGTVSTAMLTALVFGQLEHPMIDNWADRALSIATEIGERNELALVALIEAMRQFCLGNMSRMRVTIETLIEPFEDQRVWISLQPLLQYLLALKQWTLADKETCLALVDKGLQIAKATGVHMWDMILLGQGCVCALTTQDLEVAHGYLDTMKRHLSSCSKHDKSHYHYLSAWGSYLTGDLGLARTHAEKAYELKIEIGNPFGIGTNRLALAETLWAIGDRSKAEKLLADSRKTAMQCNSGLLYYLCDIAEASFALESGETERGLELVKTAFAFGEASGIYNFFWFRKELMSRLCSLAIADRVMVGYAQKMINYHGLVPNISAKELEEWPWPVKLYTLGRFELIVRGKKVQFTRKGQEKPMALLMAIAAFGGRNVDSYSLVEALWPDSDGAAGQQALATTLHRLRKIIAIDDAIIFSKGAVTLNPEAFWVDIWAVERSMGSIGTYFEDGLLNSEYGSGIFTQIEKALNLYKGHFLSHDGTEPWCITPRERLRSKYIRNLTNYCSYLEQQGENKKAVKWYQKALELEDLAEELHQGLIRSYHKLGMKSEAISAYNRCRHTLSEVLGVEPSRETEEIRKAVLEDG